MLGQLMSISVYLVSVCSRMRDTMDSGDLQNIRFKDMSRISNADVAQWLERGSYKSAVAGSNPAFSILLYN